MKDYISREDAIEALSHPVSMSMCFTKEEVYAKRDQRDIDIALIRELPTADVVEVVRCKDCQFCIEWDGRLSCEWHGFYKTESEWFCADGERRSE